MKLTNHWIDGKRERQLIEELTASLTVSDFQEIFRQLVLTGVANIVVKGHAVTVRSEE